MCYLVLVSWLANKDAAIKSIVGIPEHVKQEISGPDKTDREDIGIFRCRLAAFLAPAPEIENTIGIGLKKDMNVSFHENSFTKLLPFLFNGHPHCP